MKTAIKLLLMIVCAKILLPPVPTAAAEFARISQAQSIYQRITKERNDLVALGLTGRYLESGQFEPRITTGIIVHMSKRRGVLPRVAAMTAFSPMMPQIIQELMNTKAGHSMAALILTIHERAEAYERGDLPSTGGTYKPERLITFQNPPPLAQGNVQGQIQLQPQIPVKIEIDNTQHLRTLIKSRNASVLELALLACGFKRATALTEQIVELKVPKGVAFKTMAAHQYCLARLGKPISEEIMASIFKVKTSDRRYVSVNPALSSYDVRGPAQMYACWAAGAAKDKRALTHLYAALDHKDLRISFEAALALEQIGDSAALAVLIKKLKTAEDWPIKVACLSAIGAIPDLKSVPTLIELMRKEQGRFRQDFIYALSSISCKQHGMDKQDWYNWWGENRDSFEVDPAKTKVFREQHRVQDMKTASLTSFYGAGIISNRAVFVLDASGSMSGQKMISLKQSMNETLTEMPSHMSFNILEYNSKIRNFFGKLISSKYQRRAAYEIENIKPSGATRTYDAIEQGLSTPGVDTVILFTDGSPNGGQYNRWKHIRKAMNLYSKHRPVAMICIYFSGQQAAPINKLNQPNQPNQAIQQNQPRTHPEMAAFAYQNWGMAILPGAISDLIDPGQKN